MHNAAYAALGLPFLMAAAQVKAAELQQTMRSVRALGIRGLAVTMPHKVEILPMLDAIEPLARAVGAVNSVRNDNGVLTGFNTDVLGIVTPLERSGPLTGKRVALLGAGGAAQAAAHGCASRGAAVTIFNRSPEKARALASACGGTVSELGSSPDLSAFEIIINTTPVGMGAQSGESPIPASSIAPHHTVFETIYHPRTTQLVKDAELRGARVIRGLEMFIEQGLAQFEIHTAVKGARSAMEDALNSASAS
jgi:shikimate dehydrogenase